MKEQRIRIVVKQMGILLFCLGIPFFSNVYAQGGPPPVPESSPAPTPLPKPFVRHYAERGLLTHEEGAYDGYTLVATRGHNSTFLINNDGYVVHEWRHEKLTSLIAYLLPNGNLLHTVAYRDEEPGDIVQELTWDGEVVWEYVTDRSVQRIHHDVERLPNGNTLVTVWEKKDEAEYIEAGRDPDSVPEKVMWVDAIHEIKPKGKTDGELVWRWSVWDHLVQDYDPNKSNYGIPSEHPDRIDLNQYRNRSSKLADWLHINSVSYIADRDELILSIHALSEMWVVSKKTGNVLYRWGNPQRYGKGSEKDRKLFNQHDPHVIADGLRGAGNILIFNNETGIRDVKERYSSVIEIKPPLDDAGKWPLPNEDGFPACDIKWVYAGKPDARFYSSAVSNAQRLKNGNTLITAGVDGLIFEIDAQGELVWEYVNPIKGEGDRLRKLEKWRKGPPPGENLIFRAYKYSPDYPAFSGKDLSPKRLLKDVAEEVVVPPSENKE
jgi:hypothetical protein